MKGFVLVAAVLVAVAGCSTGDDADSDLTTTTAARASTTAQAPTTTTADPGTPTTTSSTTSTTLLPVGEAPPLSSWLTVDAFAGQQFGVATRADVLEVVTPHLGTPSEQLGPECSTLDHVRWGHLYAYFKDDLLVGWWYADELGLATPSGVAPFETGVDDLFATYGELGLHVVLDAQHQGTFIYVLDTSHGPAYLAGHIALDTVLDLFAGETCLGPTPLHTAPEELALAFYDSYLAEDRLSFIATEDAIDWMEEFAGGREQAGAITGRSLDTNISLEQGLDPSGCWLYGDVTFTCVLRREADAAIFVPLVFWIQDIARPGPDPEDTWLGAYVVVLASDLSDLVLND